MFLRKKVTHDLVEVLSLNDLFDPHRAVVVGRIHAGEEMQDSDKFAKTDMQFPSGEDLPVCWVNPHYRAA